VRALETTYNRIRKARHKFGTIAAGAVANYDVDEDVHGNGIPARIIIQNIHVHPSASTVRAVRIFSRTTRVIDPTDDDYSLVYEDTWIPATADSDLPTDDTTKRPYIDEDAMEKELPDEEPYYGQIYLQLEVRAGEDPSGFMVDIYYKE